MDPPRKRTKIALYIKPLDINGDSIIAPIVNIDPHGDVIFDIGEPDKNILLRVGSEVLKKASKVFAAMLGPKFLEGHDLGLESSTPKSPKAIRLPEDSRIPFTILCSVINGKYFYPLDMKAFAGVACLIHKYACADITRSWSQTLLQRWASQRNPDWRKLLLFAYECEDTVMFYRASREVMWRYNREIIMQVDDTILPKGLLESLGYGSSRLCMDLNMQISISYDYYYSLQTASDLSHNDVQCTAVARIGAIGKQMHRLGRRQLQWDGSCEDVRRLVLKLDQAEVASANSPCSCECCKFDMKGHLFTSILTFEHTKANIGACLTCVKQGKYSMKPYDTADKRNCGLLRHREVQEDRTRRICCFCGHDAKKKPESRECETKDGTSCLTTPFIPNQQSSS